MSLVDYLSRIILISTSLELSGVFGITVCRNRYVSGEVGRNVTLHLDQTRITFATWDVCIGDGERHLIAHTYPGKPMEIIDPRYTGRLNNIPDGSLVISKLTKEDQTVYSTGLFVREGVYQCDQRYNLTVNNQSENDDKVKPDTRRKTLYANLPCISKAKAFENLKSRPCRSRHVTGVEGKSVTLPLDQSGITHATWELCTGERNIIATTFSEKTLNIQDRRYNGRLSSTPDGSLVISKLTQEDQNVYNTDMFVNQVYRCEQRYNLTVINQSIRDMISKPGTEQTVYADIPCPAKTFVDLNAEPCRSRQVTGVEGENVTLELDLTGITFVTWEVCVGERNFFANTYPGKPVEVLDPVYNGRLSSTQDGSLVIAKLTMKDQIIYNADLFVKKQVYRCDQRYNLTVTSKLLTNTNFILWSKSIE
ncbi:uncharacterized protein LOC134582569 [Pelobates fuscus]|uniref:uncharacterized protein LOC134582569 n=1 Tax=Pelobates fuscus TaxID=191477 RepID=UPI002FE4D410